jgi:hypothetical protein
MKPAYKKILGYACIGLGLLCILSWLLNSVGWIRLGNPQGQLMIAPVCFVLGALLLKEKSQTE